MGAQYGFGALRRGSKTVGYYRTGAASYGFQAGVKKFGYALFFMTDSALTYLDKSGAGRSAPGRVSSCLTKAPRGRSRRQIYVRMSMPSSSAREV